jgi:S1-C subfamily serine protease
VKIVLATMGLAVLFGVISGFVFTKMQAALVEKQQQQAMQEIEIPKDQPEELPDASQEEVTSEEEVQEPIVVEAELTLAEYEKLYQEMRNVAGEASKSLVIVTAVSNDVDWFNEAYENRGQATGMIIGNNGVELLILTRYELVENCDGMNVTFIDDTMAPAVLKKYDVTTSLAVISVNLSDISAETMENISQAKLGRSIALEAGTPVMAVGRADGSIDSVMKGTLTSTHNKLSAVDAEYTVLVTDMTKNAGADGVLINFKGEVIGILQERHLLAAMQNVLSAYAISDIKSLMEHLSNNQDVTYLGVKGISVTLEAQKEGVPTGVYVTEVEMDSPAMLGGIQVGDVIQAINGQKVTNMSEVAAVLQRLSDKQNISLEGQRLTKDGYKKINYQTALSVLE